MSHPNSSNLSETTTFEAEVTALTHQGYGIVRHPNGKVFFVKGAWPGDQAEFRFLTADLAQKRPPFATLEKLLSPSPDRLAPACPHFGFGPSDCQGCSWMMAKPESQLAHKQNRLSTALADAGLSVALNPIWLAPEVLGYRNRAQFKTDGQVLGYVSDNTQIAPIEDCLILNDAMRAQLKSLLKKLPNPAWKPVAGKTWTFLDCDDDMKLGDVVLNRRRPFRQGNSAQNQKMRDWLAGALRESSKTSPVLELFCGSGNFTEVLVHSGFQDVACVESDETAIFKIKQKNWPGVLPLAADLYRSQTFGKLQQKMGRREILVLDPPREGLQNKAQLFQAFPKINSICYISCDPESFARDAAFFVSEQGFAVSEIQPLDLFPQTPHVEILGLFKRSV